VCAFLFLYLAALLPLTYFSYHLPSIVLFRRNGTYAGDWIHVWPWSTFVVWVACMIAGYSFVAYVTENRSNPFKSRVDTYKCFLLLVFTAPFVFLCGPVRGLREPSTTSHLRAFFYDSLFVAFYFVGLQFTYLDSIMLFRRAGDKFGTPSLWKTYTKTELAVIVPIILSMMGVVAWHLYLIFEDSLVVWYSIFYGVVLLAMVLPTVIFRKTHHLHMHHYGIFGLLIPFFAFPNAFSMACLGVVSGVYVEGIGRWGMSWFWYPGAQREY